MSTVMELIDSVKHRIDSRTNIYPQINKAIRIINKRLMYHDSDLVTGALSVSVSAAATTATMPADFWGLRGYPYISGDTTPLMPLPSKKTNLLYSSPAVPLYYEVQGQTLKLIPGTSSAITILGDYWQRPAKISAPGDTIPYFEQFDDAISEFLIESVKATPKQEGDLQALIISYVDDVVSMRDMKGPTLSPCGIDWEALANG